MAKFRKVPVVIEAEQYIPGEQAPAGVVLNEFGFPACIFDVEQNCHVRVNANDWIITGVKGEKYPCSDDVFQRTYQAVEE